MSLADETPDSSDNLPFDAKAFVANVTGKPGVYRMLDAQGEIIYVGKARNLKKRLASYFTGTQAPKTRALVSHIADIEITVTHTETEALLLENNLIKKHQPRYNILLRDDKSYPYIFLSADEFPRLSAHRGAKRAKGRYFGPYPSIGSVHDSLNLLQKVFPVRQCRDSFYRNRSRPCLQYQIKRCTAPCTGLIDRESYGEDVKHAVLFLEGKSHAVINALVANMEAAAAKLEYEKAARYRDQIAQLRKLQQRQYMDTAHENDIDIVACVCRDNSACVQVLTVRGGRHLGSKAYFPKQAEGATVADVLAAFLPQYYLARSRDLPTEIIVNTELDDLDTLAAAVSTQRGSQVRIHHRVRSARARWVAMAEENAEVSLKQRQPGRYRDRLVALAGLLHLEELPQRLECFDISHTQGEHTIAACVVFDTEGHSLSNYRRYNIRGIQAGDDFGAMRQALLRRFGKGIKPVDPNQTALDLPENDAISVGEQAGSPPLAKGGQGGFAENSSRPPVGKRGGESAPVENPPSPFDKGGREEAESKQTLPDLLLIDGGKPQLAQARQVLEELQLDDSLFLLGIAKGSGRKADFDRLVLPDQPLPLVVPKDSPALHLLQELRDEAHRFAITGHRKRRAKARNTSTLETIDGIGAKRRRRLISHFGGLQGVMRAGVEDLLQVPGIHRQLAQKIYDIFHEGGEK